MKIIIMAFVTILAMAAFATAAFAHPIHDGTEKILIGAGQSPTDQVVQPAITIEAPIQILTIGANNSFADKWIAPAPAVHQEVVPLRSEEKVVLDKGANPIVITPANNSTGGSYATAQIVSCQEWPTV